VHDLHRSNVSYLNAQDRPLFSTGGTCLVADLEFLLLDPFPLIDRSLRATLAEMNRPLAANDDLDWVVNVPLVNAAIALLGDERPARIHEFSERYRQHFSSGGRHAYQPRPHAREALQRVRERAGEVVYFTHIGPTAASDMLNHHRLATAVTNIYTGSGPQCRFCRPGLLQRLRAELDELGVSDCVFASDDPEELGVAQGVGFQTLGVLFGRSRPESIRQAAPHATLSSLGQLPATLTALSARPGHCGMH